MIFKKGQFRNFKGINYYEGLITFRGSSLLNIRPAKKGFTKGEIVSKMGSAKMPK